MAEASSLRGKDHLSPGQRQAFFSRMGGKEGETQALAPVLLPCHYWDLFTPISRTQQLRAEAGRTSLEPIHPTQFSGCSRCLSKAKGSSLTWAMQGAQLKIRVQTVVGEYPASLGLKHGSQPSKHEQSPASLIHSSIHPSIQARKPVPAPPLHPA